MLDQKSLENLIELDQEAYYQESDPVMTDSEFDVLWDTLATKFPDSKILKAVGNDSTANWSKAKHILMMGSQNKATFLVNNDTLSMSSKNKKALELKVSIISEDSLLSMLFNH